MATISARTNDKVFSVQKWYGLNEHPDGDTRLKMGEASTMVNWRITRDGNLKLRPGQEFVAGLGPSYTATVSETLSPVGVYNTGDILVLISTISDTAIPGTLVPVGGDAAAVDGGKLYAENASVSGGKFNVPSSVWSVATGILENTGTAGTPYMVENVAAILDALAEGTYLYYQQDDVTYALGAGCMTDNEDGTYLLSGYITTAEASGTAYPVESIWSGVLGGHDVLLAACNGGLWSLYDDSDGSFSRSYIGAINTDKGVHFFMFDGIVYVLNGYNYYKIYDPGTGLTVTKIDNSNAYIPLVAISIGPNNTADAGELTGEYVNLLSNKRRVWLSPDGTNKTFQLPEKDLKAITSIKSTTDGSTISGWTGNTTNGTVTFTSAPARAVNSMEVEYSVYLHTDTGHSSVPDYYGQVAGMLFSELYSGTTDTRIFIYGDGSNKALYSGMDGNGMPRADYFPDSYEIAVGDSNTPLTDLIRHGGTLIAYKPDECWSIQHGIIELADQNLTPALYCAPVNRDRGNVSPGQVCLVNNSPITTCGTELYQWTNSSYYTSNLTRDERQAKRISDRIQSSIKEIDFKTCRMWDDNDAQEFYLCGDNMALVWNYAADAWYRYENFDCAAICSFHGELYIGTHDGKVRRMSDYVMGDDGRILEAVWESGAMDFGAAYSRKYSAAVWVGLKPIKGTSVDVTVVTDRKNTFQEKVVVSDKAKVPGEPFMTKVKLKAKKFVFYHLKLSVDTRMPPVTVTNVEIRVRMTSDAK